MILLSCLSRLNRLSKKTLSTYMSIWFMNDLLDPTLVQFQW